MKKNILLLFTSIIFTLSFSFLACTKNNTDDNENEFIPKNETVTINGKNGITVTASDIYSKKSSFKREIIINDPISKTTFPKIYMSFISDDNENIYEKIKKRPNLVNGIFLIEIEGQVILRKRIVNGSGEKSQLISKREQFQNQRVAVACTVSTIHDCVSWEIDDMNWIEYGACLISAPGCYAALWASCTWEVCYNNKTYVNPY